METQELEVVQTTPLPIAEVQTFELHQRMAHMFVVSGLFSDVKGQTIEQAVSQAYVKIALGQSMGFSAAESMQGIDLIQGRPAVGAHLRAARMQRAGFSWRFVQMDNKGCVLDVYSKAGEKLGTVSFTEDDAKSAGLSGKENWKKNPSDMYFARAITRAQRRFAPGVLSLDVLSSEEAVDFSAFAEVPQAQIATESATEKLAEKLAEKRAEGEKQTAPAQAGDVF
jgi:hypothetical protein